MPELLMGEYLTGFDTISYYIPITLKWVNSGVSFWEFFGTAPMFYLILSSLTLAGVPLVVSLKVLPPLLHGLLGFIIFCYATKSLSWPSKKGALASSIATLYFIGLRISWDMLRCELGLIFLFLFLIILDKCIIGFNWKYFGALIFSMMLIVLTHQLVSIIMFVIVLAISSGKLLHRNYLFIKRIFFAMAPSIMLFALILYADYVVLPKLPDGIADVGLNWRSLMGYSSIFESVANILCFSLFCYLPLLPLVAVGIKSLKRLEFKAWIIWCLIGVILPFFFSSAPLSYRWILLLEFPFAFFTVEGFKRFNWGFVKGVIGAFTVLLSLSFVLLPAETASPYFSFYLYYVPSSMLQNSVPLSDCKNVVEALNLVEALDSSSILLVHDAFQGWALLYIDDVKLIRYGYASPDQAALAFSQQGYMRIFLVWWTKGDGWHGQPSLPPMFTEVFRSGRIGVYKFEKS